MVLAQHPHQTNLPAQVSSFIGRERELSKIQRLLRQRRLVTLTGAGGTGKTRLALHAASAELDRFADGVWLVELAPLTSSELVTETIGQALGVTATADSAPLGGLCAFLHAKQLLLLLDNCEHVITACARIASSILAQCPAVTMLVTSREPLGAAGEWLLRVPPLGLPDASQPIDPEQILRYDGIRLFIERAQAAEPSFRLTDINAASVVDICRRLDGIPLALELAAVRVRGMGVAYLSARLDDRFRLLAGGDRASAPRQQTLHTSLDWSHSLLSEPERVILRRLAVFAGTFPLDAAEAVCAGPYASQGAQATIPPDAVLERLLQLVNKSLIQFDQESGRYRLLETIRLYARERLDEADETNDITQQHFAYYLHLAEDSATLIGGPDQVTWFTRIEQEHDNYRAALDWAIRATQGDEATRMALGLWRFWHTRTYQQEGLRWLERILALDATAPLPDALRPQLFNALGVLAHRAGQVDRAHTYHAEALRLWTAANDQAGIAQALFDIGWLHHDQVELELARQCAAQSLSLAESVGDTRLIANALLLGALLDIESSQLRSALGVEASLPHSVIPALERSQAIWRTLGDMDNLAAALAGLAIAHHQCGDYERAKPLLAESARLYVRLGSYGNLVSALVGLMQQAAGMSDQMEMARDAARMIGVLAAWEEKTSGTPSPWWSSKIGRALIDKVTRRLGSAAFTQALAEGRSLTTAGFLTLVDRITTPASHDSSLPPPGGSTAPHTSLTTREVEVLRLVATGLTNAQIAERLTVTPRTVNAHLTAIYGKLGVTGRSAAIRYALDHQLG